MDALGSVVIRRYDDNRNIVDKIRPTMIYAPKQRVLYDIVNKSKAIILPVISVYQAGLTRDNDRVFNKLEGSFYDTDLVGADVAERLLQPVPVDVAVNVSFVARYQADIDQLLTNFMPYFDPYIVIEWHVPAFGHIIKTPVHWSGSVSLTYPMDISADSPYRITADTSFTIKGWIFKAQPKGVEKIYKIDSTYTSVRDLPLDYIDVRTEPGSEYLTDFLYISAAPRPLLIDPEVTTTAVSSTDFSLYGDMLANTIAVFLSGSAFGPLTSVNYFSTNDELSAAYPAFSGTPVDFDIINNNKLTFTAPSAIAIGSADVIVVNLAGYKGLIFDASHLLLENPYLSTDPNWSSWVSPVSPAASGIRVI